MLIKKDQICNSFFDEELDQVKGVLEDESYFMERGSPQLLYFLFGRQYRTFSKIETTREEALNFNRL